MRFLVSLVVLALAGPVGAQSNTATDAAKFEQCEASARLIGAVQQARLDRVRKAKAADTVLSSGGSWPKNIQSALPTIVDYVYTLPRKQLNSQNLGEITRAQCLAQYEQVQGLTGSGSN